VKRRRASVYPQVEPGAASLVNAPLAAVARGATVTQALALARRRAAPAVTVGAAVVLREDLARAEALGLAGLPAARLARPVPVVGARVGEVAVLRLLAAGAPLVVVREGLTRVAPDGAGRVIGGVVRAAGVSGAGGISLAGRLARALPVAVRDLLARVGALAEAHGGRAFLVGGMVRDALAGGAPAVHDLDVVVEGDGLAVARLLAAEIGGTVIEHRRFLTASVRGAPAGRIDIATARSERYAAAGALPSVMPAGILQDLQRRDFTVNAMAVELASGAFTLLDPVGGRADLARRRLRVLHPLSFVEDPTRILRAARYAARLGLAPDAWTRRCVRLALEVVPFDAVSGPRIVAELELIAAEATAADAVLRLGRWGALRLVDPRHRFTRRVAGRLRQLDGVRAWAERRLPPFGSLELVLMALLADLPAAVAADALRRLSVTGEPSARILRGLEAGPAVAAGLDPAAPPSAVLRAIHDLTPAQTAWLWLLAGPAQRGALDRALGRSGQARAWLSGDELVALGVPRGPAVSRVLRQLRDAQVDATIADRAAAVSRVRQWVDADRARHPGDRDGTNDMTKGD
jgi:tRNA nucleotidyltransferase (CCA-adding enzyme)